VKIHPDLTKKMLLAQKNVLKLLSELGLLIKWWLPTEIIKIIYISIS